MKLYKALKLKKKLSGEIARIENQILTHNSYVIGAKNSENCDVEGLERTLGAKVSELIDLKVKIYEANKYIQKDIYTLAETKGLLAFWVSIGVTEGKIASNSLYERGGTYDYAVHVNEESKDAKVKELQDKIETLQENIDTYNYLTEI